MLGIALALLASLPAPQDTTTLDAPVYANEAYGVSVPRPFDDWVFEPGAGPQTTTVIFHPRTALLRDQLWGALILTTFPAKVALRRVTDQRVTGTWQRLLGRTYELISSDSLTVGGLPAIRTAMSGAINHVALDVEEYAIARDSDLIILQLRYPRGLSHDSIAAGYRRVVRGLRIRGAPPPEPATPADLADSGPPAGLVPRSPFQVSAYDALVRYDAPAARVDVAVRADIVNAGEAPGDSLPILLWRAFTLDSVRGPARAVGVRTGGGVSWVHLAGPVEPQGVTTLTFFVHAAPGGRPFPPQMLELAPTGAFVAADWLPRVQPEPDSAGQAASVPRSAITLRFDLPQDWHALAQGHLATDAISLGRRLTTWRSEDVGQSTATFAIGPYRAMTRRDHGLTVSVWLAPGDSLASGFVDSLADSIRDAWDFCGGAFGRLPIDEMNVVAAGLPEARGFLGLLLVGHPGDLTDSARDSTRGAAWLPFATLAREVARTWWGNSVTPAGPGSAWILESFPAWTALAARGTLEGDTVRQRLVREEEAGWRGLPAGGGTPLSEVPASDASDALLRTKGVAAIEAVRRAVGEARFREGLMTLSVEHRNARVTLDDVLAAFGDTGATVLRPYLY